MSLLQADALRIPLADGSVHCCVTSPPYWGLRDYGTPGQLGLESTPDEFVAKMVSVFREMWRVLRDDGTLWLNLGDSYAANVRGSGGYTDKQSTNRGSFFAPSKANHGLKSKDLIGIPWRVAFALQADGWYLRSDIIWSKPNPMPESVTDRPTKAHEYLFLLAKQERYYYDAEAVKEDSVYPDDNRKARAHEDQKRYPGEQVAGVRSGSATYPTRNRRTVWEIPTAPYSGAHFATFPPALVEPCILAGTSAAGACSVCGAPWERVTEPTPDYAALLDRNKGKNHVATRDEERVISTRGQIRTKTGNVSASYATTGWAATCAHADAPTVPAIVLDPFCGSGTTGQVARLHGRRFVGLDISGVYLRELALPRAEGLQTAASLARLPLWAVPSP